MCFYFDRTFSYLGAEECGGQVAQNYKEVVKEIYGEKEEGSVVGRKGE